MWAELLGFADRMFYGDWWNTRSFARYFAAWNVVVGDWLYTYLYSEVYVVRAKYSPSVPTTCPAVLL